MSESVSQRCIDLLWPLRDELYAQALAAGGDPIHAEGLLQEFLHGAFASLAQADSGTPVAGQLRQQLATLIQTRKLTIPTAPPPAAMPADTWARLAGAIQIEAARLGGSKALNPDSVLLNPDPLLAPRKARPQEDTPELHPTSRWLLVAAAALGLGVLVTIYMATRPAQVRAPATRGAAATQGR